MLSSLLSFPYRGFGTFAVQTSKISISNNGILFQHHIIYKIPSTLGFILTSKPVRHQIKYNSQHIGNMKTSGAQIKERRKALKITQQELADLAGISINKVVATESDSCEFSFIYDRAYLLGEVAYLFKSV